MEPEDSSSCSQEPATGPYPQPDESSPLPQHTYPNICYLLLYNFSYYRSVKSAHVVIYKQNYVCFSFWL
jgi:hypothetical protein